MQLIYWETEYKLLKMWIVTVRLNYSDSLLPDTILSVLHILPDLILQIILQIGYYCCPIRFSDGKSNIDQFASYTPCQLVSESGLKNLRPPKLTSVQFTSVAKLCLTLYDPMNCSLRPLKLTTLAMLLWESKITQCKEQYTFQGSPLRLKNSRTPFSSYQQH